MQLTLELQIRLVLQILELHTQLVLLILELLILELLILELQVQLMLELSS